MIFYATKETLERYKLLTTQEMSPDIGHYACIIQKRESGDRLLEWGVKLLYFDRRKCLQFVNFESKLTFFLVDIKVALLEQTGEILSKYMYELYRGNSKMWKLLDKYFDETPIAVWERLKDRSAIVTLNRNQSDWAKDGHRFYDYISGGILHTKKINSDINDWLFGKKVGNKLVYFRPVEEFERLLNERYK